MHHFKTTAPVAPVTTRIPASQKTSSGLTREELREIILEQIG